jgi:hypothetical protein
MTYDDLTPDAQRLLDDVQTATSFGLPDDQLAEIAKSDAPDTVKAQVARYLGGNKAAARYEVTR